MTDEDRRFDRNSFAARITAFVVVVLGTLWIQSSELLITTTSVDTKNTHNAAVAHRVVEDEENAGPPPFDYQTVGSSLARAFPSWPSDHSTRSWCIPDETQSQRVGTTGLLYVKTPKTGSTTIAGLVRRIATSQGQRSFPNSEATCGFRNRHVVPLRAYENRDENLSFLWTSVRHPSKRAISRVFYTFVTQRNWTTDDASILRALDAKNRQTGVVSSGAGGHQLKYVTMKDIPNWSAWNETNKTKVLDPQRVQNNVKNVMEAYDFFMVTERMDESVVALQLMLGAEAGDMLSTSAKVSGGWDFFHDECVKMKRSFVSPGVKAFLLSDEWHAKNYGDFLLYIAANKSLDLTIERLGRDRFDVALAEYQMLMALVDKMCSPKLVSQCSSDGIVQTELAASQCYAYDEGCGYRCIDELLLNLTSTP